MQSEQRAAALAFDPWVESWPVGVRTPDLGAALLALSGEPGLAALDSCGGRPARFDLLAFDPPRRLEGLTSIEALARELHGLRPAGWLPGPFQGGFIGALAYELGLSGEDLDLPAPALSLPPLVGGLYTDWLVWNRALGQLALVINRARPDWRARRARVLAALAAPLPAAPEAEIRDLRREVAPSLHRQRIGELTAAIAAGEVYQANLAHAFAGRASGDPLGLYLRLRRSNPAPYGAFLAFPGGALLSSSPELLLAFDGELARTRPIKGTARRDPDPERDRGAAQALLASVKDRAELTMIVDLARNDLGQVCEPGTVRVPGYPLLESYAAVHHLVAEVQGRPRAGIGALELLEALFPGASITGAPKRAAMQHIAALEGRGRGFFCGSLGFVDLRGRALLNILIRTLVWAGDSHVARLEFLVGGGITIRSDPEAEEAETLDKARALLAALSEGPR
jgi:para-aminobenzoate synthetase component 1